MQNKTQKKKKSFNKNYILFKWICAFEVNNLDSKRKIAPLTDEAFSQRKQTNVIYTGFSNVFNRWITVYS